MQAINPITSSQLLQKDKIPLLKFEIFYGCCWVDLTDLDGKDYVKSISISTAGAEMTPAPVAGSWSAVIRNKNGMFDPDETTYAPYNEYLHVGVKVKIQFGARYGGVDYYWRRIYGFMEMPDFSIDKSEVTLRGFDNMQFLTDTKLRKPNNYWGTTKTFSTVATVNTYSAEKYNELDAMDINNEANNVANWQVSPAPPQGPAIASVADGGAPGGNWVGEITLGSTPANNRVFNDNVLNGNVTAGRQYRVVFQYKNIGLGGTADVNIYESGAGGGIMGGVTCAFSAAYVEKSFFFTATKTGTIRMTIEDFTGGFEFDTWRIDVISVMEVTGTSNTRYNMDADCNGAYYATLDGLPVWYGVKDEGWYFDYDNNIFYFDDNKQVEVGVDNLVVYYFTDQIPEEVVADLLVTAGLYTTQAEALADMIYTATGITINQVWFDAGTTVTDAVRLICERCDYRFYLNYSGRPVFNPVPSSDIADGSLDYDNLVGSFLEGETITGGTSGATATVKSDDGSTLEIIDCSGCFNNNEQITGGVSAATADVNHPDGAVGADEHVKNGAFVDDNDPPADWTAVAATLTTEGGGVAGGNCMQVASSGAALGKAYQDITTVVGRRYRLDLYFKKGTSATGKFMIGITTDQDSIYDSGALSDAAWAAYSHTFVATATTTRITMQTTDPTATENSLFDEITHYDLTGVDFTFDETEITNIQDYEDRNEIRNRIVIKGRHQAQFVERRETMPSELDGRIAEVASINKYGEHTWSMDNHLFQDQPTIDASVATYLAAFKDPKWYTTFETPYNPVPLAKGDMVKWRKQYEVTGTPINQRGMIRNIEIDDFTIFYIIEKV